MDDTVSTALGLKARSERLYMHYALLLALLLALGGTALVILGAGNHMDILIEARGDLNARFVNASPGVVMWLVSALVFWLSKPRQLVASTQGRARRLMFGLATRDEPRPVDPRFLDQ